MTENTATTQMYRVVIKATPQAIWDAITSPDWTDRYGYGGRAEYALKPGGRYCHHASAEMKSFGMPEEMIVGEVIETDPPRKLVHTWHPLWSEESAAEKPTRLTYEIVEHQGGVCTLTLYHDVEGAPSVGRMISGGGDPVQGGGGWPWVLSDLKSLLETGKRMAA
jgi:uncharacterized protein YndB with AHSA1/START domain